MIGFLSGKVLFKELNHACLDVNGVGYNLHMPVPDLARMGEVGQSAKLHVHTHVREGAIDLFGFLTADGLAIFLQLIQVSGVGPKMALAVLSGMEIDDMMRAILEEDVARLTKIPGVGKKTAGRLILELQDKFKTVGLKSKAMGGTEHDVMVDVRSALENLGYKGPQVERAVKAIRKDAEGKELQDLVLLALKHV
ncbi:MAG: Holliday junction branch migration protein RuvA [Deltaproteobacteria bacterium]|nr:Holliday junction branch migration protein RuvA [Deltaproteobacteria bacterium]